MYTPRAQHMILLCGVHANQSIVPVFARWKTLHYLLLRHPLICCRFTKVLTFYQLLKFELYWMTTELDLNPSKGIRGSSYVFLNKWSIFISHNRHYHVFRYLIRVVTDLFFNCVLSYILRLLVWSKWCGKYMDPTDSSR